MKKNHVSRILAMAMALVMILCAFTGCGKSSQKQDESLIIGKWQTSVDLAGVMDEALKDSDMTEEAEIFGDTDLSGITMLLNMEFKEDGTYTVSLDNASGEDAVKQMAQRMIPALKEYLRGVYASSTGADASAVTDEELDLLLPQMGMESWDDMGEMIMGEIDTDEMFAEANSAGKYMLKDGKLYTTDSVDEEATVLSEASEYELSENSLKLMSKGDDVPSFLEELNFTRVN